MNKTEYQTKGIQLDWDYIDKALDNLMTSKQICDALKIQPKTLSNHIKRRFKMNFEEYRDHRRAETFQRILAAQIKIATGYTYQVSIQTVKSRKTGKGQEVITDNVKTTKTVQVLPDPKMLIHLGQQYLNQRPVMPKNEDENQPTGYVIEDESGNIIEDQTDDKTHEQSDS